MIFLKNIKNFLNIFYNFDLKKDSVLKNYKVDKFENKNIKYSYNNIEQDKNSISETFILSSGSNFFKNEINCNLNGEYSSAFVNGIFSLIKPFGLQINENLVTDKICGRVSVQQQMGPIRMNVPMEYPLLPIIRSFNNNEAIVSGLEQIQLIFASEINLDSSSVENLNVVPLFFTSNQSGEMRGNFNLNPDPTQNPFISIFNLIS